MLHVLSAHAAAQPQKSLQAVVFTLVSVVNLVGLNRLELLLLRRVNKITAGESTHQESHQVSSVFNLYELLVTHAAGQ